MDVTTYALLVAYVKNALKNSGGGSGGKNCTISRINPVEGGNEVVFAWYLDDGTAQTTSLIVKNGEDGADGVGIKSVNINADNKIVCTMSDGTTITSQDPLALESDDVGYTNTDRPTVSDVKGALDNIFTQLDNSTVPDASDILFEDGESLQKKFEDNSLAEEEASYSAGTGIHIDENHVIAIKDIKKNYVDNSNFRINQNGKSEYSTPNEYTVDRWYIDGGTLTPVENGVLFTNPNTATGTSSLTRLRQNIHYRFVDFANKTVTLSAKIDGVIYSGTTTIPAEKPTTGSAMQYITSGTADYSVNLNYSVTADYFVPYFALAYGRSAVFEWIKLEVNDTFSGYVEPDYMTELIKINLTTPDKGALSLPEAYDDTEIRSIASSKLDQNGSADNLEYTDYTKDVVVNSEIQIDPLMPTYGSIIELAPILSSASQIYGFKKIDDKYYFYGMSYLASADSLSDLSSDSVTPIITQQSNIGGVPIRDVCVFYDVDIPLYLICDGYQTYLYNELNPNTLYPINFAEGSGRIDRLISVGEKIYGLDTTNKLIYFFNHDLGGVWELEFEIGKELSALEVYAQDSNGCVAIPLMGDIAFYDPVEGMWNLGSERYGYDVMDTVKHIACIDDVFYYISEAALQGRNTWSVSESSWEYPRWEEGYVGGGMFTGDVNSGHMFGGNGTTFYTMNNNLWFADADTSTMTDIVGCIAVRPSMESLHYLYSCGAIYLLVEHTRMVKIDFVASERMLTEDISALKCKIKTLEALIKELTVRMDDAGF